MVAKMMFARMLAAALVALALVPAAAATALADEEVEFDWVRYTLHEEGDGAWATVSKGYDTPDPVTIPGSVEHGGKSYAVTAIGDYAFQDCGNLQSVGIPASVTSIGEGAFQGCTSLGSVEIPASVTSIGMNAFASTSLSSVTFAGESQLETIGSCAFYNCGALGSIDIPASVREIGQYAFNGAGLTSVALPEGLESISQGMFKDCGSLAQVDIPSTVTSIGHFAFSGCSVLSTVVFGGSRLQWAAITGSGKPDAGLVDPGKYDVTFDPRGGSAVDPQVVDKGGTVAKPQDPTKDGLEFGGWYADESLTDSWWFSNAVSGDMTLHASWYVPMSIGIYNQSNPADYQCGAIDVEALDNGYSEANVQTMNYSEPEGENLKFTAKPAEGYVFKGWYEGVIGSSYFVEGPTGDPISENPELTAAAEDAACICAVFECAGHQWEQKVQKATPTADGRVYQECGVCGAEQGNVPLPKVGTIKLSGNAFTYTGKAIQPKVTVANASEALSADCYTVSYSNNVNAGTATAKVTLKGAYHEGSKTLRFTIAKAANTLTAKAKTKKAVAVKAGKALAAKKLFKVSKAKGKVAYKKAKGSKKITVAKDGRVSVKKGCKAGTYALTVKVRAAGDANHKASAWKAVKVKVKVG